MTLIVPPGFANAAFIFTADTGTPPIVTTLGVSLAGWTGTFTDAADYLMAAYAANLASETWTGCDLERVSLFVGQDGGGGSVDSTLGVQPSGRTLSTPPPLAQCAIARKITNGLGRRDKGRMFLPATTAESEVDAGGNITTARQTALNQALGGFFTDLFGGQNGDLAPVLFHSSAPATPTPIVGFTVSQVVGWVRGRIR